METLEEVTRWLTSMHDVPLSAEEFQISTLDNPGWRIHARLKPMPPDREILHCAPIEEESWLNVRILNGTFDGAGGAHNLTDLLQELGKVASSSWRVDNAFSNLESWYASRCDGEWEHEGGVRLRPTTAGWELVLNLYDGYWPEPVHRAPPRAVVKSSGSSITVKGPSEAVGAFMMNLRPRGT